MTNFLLKTFIKDPASPDSHAAIGKLAGTAGLVCNLLLSGGKILAGILSGSVAIIGDGINNLTDSASSLVTLLGFRMAQRPADSDHPFGHARYEYLSGLVIAALILLTGTELAISSVKKLMAPDSIPFSAIVAVILLLSAGIKFWMYHFNKKLGTMIHSATLMAAAADSRNDVITTVVVTLCFLTDSLFGIHLDGAAGIGVAVFILLSGVQIAKNTISPLLGFQDPTLAQDITDLVLAHSKVLGIHDLLIHDYGPGKRFASVHAEMNAREDPLTAHDQLDHIEQEADQRLNVRLVIHWDPVVPDDQQWFALQQLATQAAQAIDPRLSIHDLRVVNYHAQPRLTFDLTAPFDMKESDQAISQQMKAALNDRACPLPAVIRIDRKA